MRWIIPGIAGLTLFIISLFFTLFHLIPDITTFTEFKESKPIIISQIKADRSRIASGSQPHYRYEFEYRYEIEDTSFSNNRATVHRSQTLNGDLESQLYHRIQEAKANSERLFCFVSPEDYSRSVLAKNLSTKTILVNILIIVLPLMIGSFAIYCAFYEYRKSKSQTH